MDGTGRSVEVGVADLNDKVDLARVEQVLRTDAAITVPVNNAGVGVRGGAAEVDAAAVAQFPCSAIRH